jgi:hypothetical protein
MIFKERLLPSVIADTFFRLSIDVTHWLFNRDWRIPLSNRCQFANKEVETTSSSAQCPYTFMSDNSTSGVFLAAFVFACAGAMILKMLAGTVRPISKPTHSNTETLESTNSKDSSAVENDNYAALDSPLLAQEKQQILDDAGRTWRCACEGGFLPPGLLQSLGGAEAAMRMGMGQCYHKKVS